MMLDEAFRRLDLSQINNIQLVVLEAAVAALVKNHPDAASVRRDFDSCYPKMHIDAARVCPGEESAVSLVAAHLRGRIFEKT